MPRGELTVTVRLAPWVEPLFDALRSVESLHAWSGADAARFIAAIIDHGCELHIGEPLASSPGTSDVPRAGAPCS